MCEIILNWDQEFRRGFKIFLFLGLAATLFSEAVPFEQFQLEPYKEHLCEVMFNLDQGFRRDHLKTVLAMTDLFV